MPGRAIFTTEARRTQTVVLCALRVSVVQIFVTSAARGGPAGPIELNTTHNVNYCEA